MATTGKSLPKAEMNRRRVKGLCFDYGREGHRANFQRATLAKGRGGYNKGQRKLEGRPTPTQVQLHTATNEEVYESLDDEAYDSVNDFAD